MEEVELLPGVELFSSMRSVGYSFEVAVADIVDNSLTAGATVVDIDVDIHHGKYVTIADNGSGMDRDALVDGMAFARRARQRGSSPEDLGRFGMGLKTASLSQASILTVFSKRDGVRAGYTWDCAHVGRVGKWVIKEADFDSVEVSPGVNRFNEFDSGTLVHWSDLDMLLREASDITEFLSEKVSVLRSHLGLVFHRFLTGEGVPRVSIVVNGRRLLPVDPFLREYPKTQIGPELRLIIDGSPCKVQGYTLPFITDIKPEDSHRSDLGSGMRENQGFYVFRNSRLISWGGWFGLRARDEAHKQARICVDLPSSMDRSWQVDMKKQRSEPPQEFRERLRDILDHLIERSRRSHAYRGRTEGGEAISYVWNRVEDRDTVRYEINRQHPAIRSLITEKQAPSKKNLNAFLRLLETSLPLYDISTVYEGGTRLPSPGGDAEAAKEKMREAIGLGLISRDMEYLPPSLLMVEPFAGLTDPQSIWNKVRNEDG